VVRLLVRIDEDRRGKPSRCAGFCCTTGTAGKMEGGSAGIRNRVVGTPEGWSKGAYEGSLLGENGTEHLQDLALGKLCAEGIIRPGRLRERGIDKSTHILYAWAVSRIVNDGVRQEGESRVVDGSVRRPRRWSVVCLPGNSLTMILADNLGPMHSGSSECM
jgi:hypothetical protein